MYLVVINSSNEFFLETYCSVLREHSFPEVCERSYEPSCSRLEAIAEPISTVITLSRHQMIHLDAGSGEKITDRLPNLTHKWTFVYI